MSRLDASAATAPAAKAQRAKGKTQSGYTPAHSDSDSHQNYGTVIPS